MNFGINISHNNDIKLSFLIKPVQKPVQFENLLEVQGPHEDQEIPDEDDKHTFLMR